MHAYRANMPNDPSRASRGHCLEQGQLGGTTHPVGLKQPNAFGLYDMFGNVAEWTQDTYYDSHEGAPTNGSAREGDSRAHTLKSGGSGTCRLLPARPALRGPATPIHRLGFAHERHAWPKSAKPCRTRITVGALLRRGDHDLQQPVRQRADTELAAGRVRQHDHARPRRAVDCATAL